MAGVIVGQQRLTIFRLIRYLISSYLRLSNEGWSYFPQEKYSWSEHCRGYCMQLSREVTERPSLSVTSFDG